MGVMGHPQYLFGELYLRRHYNCATSVINVIIYIARF